MKPKKKGSIGQTVTLIVGVGVAVLVLIFVGVLGGQTYQMSESKLDAIEGTSTVIDETFTASTNVLVALDKTDLVTGTVTVYNNSNVVDSSNYSVDLARGDINVTDARWNTLDLTIQYDYNDYTIQRDIKESVVSGFSALKQTGDYLPLIVLAIIIFMILGMVLGLGVMREQRGGGEAL